MSTTTPFEPVSTQPAWDGEQRMYKFDNGYGASVIRHLYSHGGSVGFFEVAVLGPDGRLDYETPITDDVIGWLTEDMVQATLHQIAALDPVEGTED